MQAVLEGTCCWLREYSLYIALSKVHIVLTAAFDNGVVIEAVPVIVYNLAEEVDPAEGG